MAPEKASEQQAMATEEAPEQEAVPASKAKQTVQAARPRTAGNNGHRMKSGPQIYGQMAGQGAPDQMQPDGMIRRTMNGNDRPANHHPTARSQTSNSGSGPSNERWSGTADAGSSDEQPGAADAGSSDERSGAADAGPSDERCRGSRCRAVR